MKNLKLSWTTTVKILSSLAIVALLAGCAWMQPVSPTPIATPGGVWDSVATPVASSATGLWWPLLFSGFLAIMAGIINAVIFRGGHKIFLLGIVLASIPPIADYMMRQSALVISLTVLALSIMLIIYVAGKWLGWRAFGNELKPLVSKVKDRREDYTAEEAITIIENANIERPKSLQTKIQGELK